ncbi:MAG: Gfo/Idh/MocA family oxidoreductase [Ramlibacter sp.]
MRVFITGRGSIAQRHAKYLREQLPQAELGVLAPAGEVAPALQPCKVFASFEAGMAWVPQAVVIAGVSAAHAKELNACLRVGLPVLAEKPLVVSRDQLDAVREVWSAAGTPGNVLVGCNLRYLPSLRQVAQVLGSGRLGRIVRSQLEVGQDLAQWRPARDIASSYSARPEQGGGVLFDLVHEIDVARWLLGPLQVRSAVGGRFSSLPIQANDVHVALLQQVSGAPVVLSLDYVSRQLVRRYAFVGDEGTLHWDLRERRAWIQGRDASQDLDLQPADFDLASSYPAEMADWLQAVRDPLHRVASPLDEAIASTELMLELQEAAQ